MTIRNLKSFSTLHRSDYLDSATSTEFDLIVIGGGATGTGIALDAASRGLKTIVLEKSDFASGTSSKSTKLIHGGLRYLKQFEIGLVRETGLERAVVHQLAPHLVLPEKMLLPLIEGGTFGKMTANFGLLVYDVLAGVERADQRKMLSKKETLSLEPLLNEGNLKGGGYYAEYRTDDARLTIELMKSAIRYGSIGLNYCEVKDFIKDEKGKIAGIIGVDHLTNKPLKIKAKKVVAAGGPWVDELRKINKSLSGKRLHLTKGVHVVVPHKKFPLQQSVYFDAPDGRMIFAIPRGKTTYIGTTDTTYTSSLDRVVATKEDAKYLLNTVKNAFASIELNEKDLISNWAGLRPLIHEDGKSPSELSRKDEIFIADNGLIAIAGGKLTGYRKMGERIVNLVTKSLDGDYKSCQTKKIPLTTPTLENSKMVEHYIKNIESNLNAKSIEEASYYAWFLVTNYGKQTDIILEKIQDFDDENPLLRLMRAELWFGVHYEMVASILDFYVRRTGRLYFNIESIEWSKSAIISDMKNYLGWNDTRIRLEETALNRSIKDSRTYYDEEFS